ncbi:MAG: class I SAM-dependent methyltransferase [Candidatus Sericytochromatia bacterium]|nr:class I SAM-dependent methyltransferase [Candidatus Sericytochromatia bacterium]
MTETRCVQTADGPRISAVVGYERHGTHQAFIADVTAILAALPLPAGSTVLEIGAGTGQVALSLASARPDWHCVANDSDPDLLAWVARRAHESGIALRLHHQSLGPWPQAVDVVILAQPLYQFADPLAVLQDGLNALRPGGYVLVADQADQADVEALFFGKVNDLLQATFVRTASTVAALQAVHDWFMGQASRGSLPALADAGPFQLRRPSADLPRFGPALATLGYETVVADDTCGHGQYQVVVARRQP